MATTGITVTSRGLALEDLLTSKTLSQTSASVLGLGPNIPVTPILSAPNDAAALAAGLTQGDVYFVNTASPTRLRCVGGGGSVLRGSADFVVGEVNNGTIQEFANVITINGVYTSNTVLIGCTPPLPQGVVAFGKVTSANTVSIEVWCFAGSGVNLGTVLFTAIVFQ